MRAEIQTGDGAMGLSRFAGVGRVLLAAMLALAAPAALAQQAEERANEIASPAEQPGAESAEVFFNAESWRAVVEGKTLTYRASFGIMGREYYEPGSNRVVFVYFDGRCYDGTWSESNGVFCFAYDGNHCFRHLKRDGKLIAREMNGAEQVVTKITDETLSCTPDLMSRAPRFETEDKRPS